MTGVGTVPNVLHVNTAKTWRGGEQQMVYLLKGLYARGLRAEVVCLPRSPAAERSRAAGATVNELSMRFEFDPVAAFRLAGLARRGGFNILHTHTAHAHSIAWMARRFLGADCRLIVHRRIEFRPRRGIFGLGSRKYRRRVDAFIAISNRLKEILVEAGVEPWRVFTVRSVTDPERFLKAEPNPALRHALGIPEDAFVVGNIGYLVGHKDHVNLVEAAAVAIREIPGLRVVIVGSGPLKDKIEARARELGIAERVVLTGFRDDVPQLIQMFDLFALSSSEEGICSTLMDVMATGRPIVATNAAGVREAVLDGETGIVVPIKDPAALAAGIVRLHRDKDTARQMVERGRERVLRHFTAEVLTEKTIAVYQRVLAGEVGPDFPIPPEP